MEAIVPQTVTEALAALGEHPTAYPLAGGTDLLVNVRDETIRPDTVLVLEYLSELKGMSVEDDTLVVGAMTTMAEIARSPVVRDRAPILSRAASLMGSPQIRERATLGGNLMNASPAGDSIPPLMAMGARIIFASTRGRRSLPAQEFMSGPGVTVRRPGELLTEVTIPLAGDTGFFVKLGCRRAVAVAQVSVALWGALEQARFSWLRIALGAVAPTVIRAREAEQLLVSGALTRELVARASAAACSSARPIDDIRGSGVYRKAMIAALLVAGFEEIGFS